MTPVSLSDSLTTGANEPIKRQVMKKYTVRRFNTVAHWSENR